MDELRKEVAVLREEVEKIKARNKKVEADKAWEVSLTRTLFIATVTFFMVYIFSRLIERLQPITNAFFGALAYLISTFSYGILKKWWLGRRK